ncbi:MAG: hypothetical protein ACPF9T_06105, partial [Pseudomonadales bacterium]
MRALKPWVPLLGLWALTAAAEPAPGRAYYEADPSRVGVEVLGEGPLPYSSRYAPAPSGAVVLDGGEPTSVAVAGGVALVGVNTSQSFT